MSTKIDINSIFEKGDILGGLNDLNSAFITLDKTIDEIASKGEVELFGGLKSMQANEKAVKELNELIDKKNKLEKVTIKLQADIAKFDKLKAKANAAQAKADKDRIKRGKAINTAVNENLTTEQKLEKALEIKRTQLKEITKESGKTTQAYFELRDEITALNTKIKANTKVAGLNNIINDESAGKLDKLRAKKKLLEIQTNKLTEAELAQGTAGAALVDELADVNKELINFGKDTNDGRANVGRYAESLQELSSGLGDVGGELSFLSPVLSKIGGLLDKQAKKWEDVSENSEESNRSIKKNAIGLKALGGIAAGVGVAGLSAFFLKSAEGFEKFRLFTAKAKGYLNALIASFSDIGKEIVARFNAISTGVSGFFEGLGLKASKFALETKKAIQEALTFDLMGKNYSPFDAKSIEGTAKDLEDVNNQLADLEAKTKGADEAVKGAEGSFSKFLDKGAKTAKAFEAMEVLKISNEKLARSIAISTSEIDKQAKLLQDSGEDDTIYFETRRIASERAAKAFTDAATMRLKMSNNQIKVLQIEAAALLDLGLKDATVQDQLTESIVARNQLEQEYTEALRDNSEFRKKAISDEQEVMLDANLEVFGLTQTRITKELSLEKTSFEAKRKLLADLENVNKDFYENQLAIITENSKKAAAVDLEQNAKEIALMESKGKISAIEQNHLDWLIGRRTELNQIIGQEVDLSAILATTDAKQAVEMVKALKLGEKWQIRSLEVIRERITATEDLKDETLALDDAYIASAENQYALDIARIEIIRGIKGETGEMLVSTEELSQRALDAEKKLLEAQLDRFNLYRAESLTDLQISEMKRLEIAIESLNSKTKEVGNALPNATVFDKFFNSISKGFSGNADDLDKYRAQFQDAMGIIEDSFFSFLNTKNEARQADLENELAAIQEELAAKETALDIEKERALAGDANDEDIVQSEVDRLQQAEADKQEALEETQEKQQKLAAIQQALNGVLTASNMLLAASEVFKASAGIPIVGVGIAIGAIASMVATFSSLKQAFRFHDGTEFVQGKQGRDQVPAMVEYGERIVDVKSNRKIPASVKNSDLPMLVNLGLAKVGDDGGESGLGVLNISNNEAEENSGDAILMKIYEALANNEEIISLGGGKFMKVEKVGGKIRRVNNG